MPSPETPLPPTSPWLIRLFGWYTPRYLRRHFNTVRLLGNVPDTADPRPMLVYLNHPSWWDPLAVVLLIDRYFPHRPGYGPIDAEALGRYRFMEKLGFFGIDPATRAGAAKFLRIGGEVLRTPNQTLWVTAQGFFTDVRQRPIELRPGVAHLARKATGAVAVPLAVEYPFWFERRPEMLLTFGKPVELGDASVSVEQWNDTLAEGLEDDDGPSSRRFRAARARPSGRPSSAASAASAASTTCGGGCGPGCRADALTPATCRADRERRHDLARVVVVLVGGAAGGDGGAEPDAVSPAGSARPSSRAVPERSASRGRPRPGVRSGSGDEPARSDNAHRPGDEPARREDAERPGDEPRLAGSAC